MRARLTRDQRRRVRRRTRRVNWITFALDAAIAIAAVFGPSGYLIAAAIVLILLNNGINLAITLPVSREEAERDA